MMIDEKWLKRDKHSVTWWSYRLAQHIAVEEPTMIQGDPTVRVTAVMDVVAGVAPSPNVLPTIALINSEQAMGACVYNGEAQFVQQWCTAYIYDGTRWMDQIFATAALLQNTEAHSRAHAVAKGLGGKVAATSHPTGGERPAMDDLLNFSANAIVPAGSAESRFTEKDLDHLESSGTPPGAELMRQGTSLLVRLASSLLSIDVAARHPQYGSGAFFRLSFPFGIDDEKSIALAQDFNVLEATEGLGVPLLGAWTRDLVSPGAVAFVAFLPSLMHRQGLLEQWAAYLVDRSLAVGSMLAGKSE